MLHFRATVACWTSSDIKLGLSLNAQTGKERDDFNHYKHFFVQWNIEAKSSCLLSTTHLTHSEKPYPLSDKGMGWRKDFCLTSSALGGAGIPLSIRVESHDVHGIGCVWNQALQVHRVGISRHHNLERRKCQILPDDICLSSIVLVSIITLIIKG